MTFTATAVTYPKKAPAIAIARTNNSGALSLAATCILFSSSSWSACQEQVAYEWSVPEEIGLWLPFDLAVLEAAKTSHHGISCARIHCQTYARVRATRSRNVHSPKASWLSPYLALASPMGTKILQHFFPLRGPNSKCEVEHCGGDVGAGSLLLYTSARLLFHAYTFQPKHQTIY